MNYKEYGGNNKDVIIFLHGGGLSWWNYREVAEGLQDKYHIILPIVDGHCGSDRPFTTIEDNADEIIRYIDEHFGGTVLMIGGLSLGGQILLEILSRRNDICRCATIESAMVIPSRLTHAMIRPLFGCSYGLIKHRWFSRLQFRSLHIRQGLFEEYFKDSCGIKKEDMIAFLQANTSFELKESIRDCSADVHIYYGQREISGIIKSAAQIHKLIQDSHISILPQLYHGEFSINRPDDYVREAEKIINGVIR